MKRVFNFLGVPNYRAIEYVRHNQGYYKANKHLEIRQAMQDFFAPYNQQLEKLLGRKFNWDRSNL